MDLIEQTIREITAPDAVAAKAASSRLDSLTKPPGSLGRLEEIAIRYAGIRHDPAATMGRCAILVFVADHGIADAGVSAYPKAVTVEMLRNIGAGGAAISVLARRFGYELLVFDVGVEQDTSTSPLAGVRYRRIAPGTRNFLEQPAMTAEQARAAVTIGIEAAHEAASDGSTLIGIGEMGIANSTSAAAILSAVAGVEPITMVGRGTGIDDAGLRRKAGVISEALAMHRDSLQDGLSMLAAVGGFEIGAMTGACIGGASRQVPVVIDGFIATAAAAIAEKLCPGICKRHLFFSHVSAEGGHALAIESLGAQPLLSLRMRLGEGTGAAIAMNLIEASLALFHEMATFASAGVSGKIA